jgi:hypothetical protein
MAPEQAEAGKAEIDARTDLYALGATLHALLTGRPPLDGAGYSLLKKILTEQPRGPRAAEADVPRELDALVLRLLAKDPTARPASALEVAAELDVIRASARSARPRTLVAALASVALLGVAVVAGVLALRRREPAEPPAAVATPAAPARPLAPSPAPSPSPSPSRNALEPKLRWRGKVAGSAPSCVFSREGKFLVTGTGQGRLVVWGADQMGTDARETSSIKPYKTAAWCLATTPDRRRVVSGTKAGHLFVWDLEKLTAGESEEASKLGALGLMEQPIDAVAVSPQGDHVAVETLGGVFQLALSPEGTLTARGLGLTPLPIHQNGGDAIAFLTDSRIVSAARDSTELATFDLATDRVARTVKARAVCRGLVSFAKGHKFLAGLWDPGLAEVWDDERAKPIATLETEAPVRAVAVSADERFAYTGDLESHVRVWSTSTWTRVTDFKVPDKVASLAASPEGYALGVGTEGGDVEVWDLIEKK